MFVLCGVVGGVGDDGVHECGFSVYGGFNASGDSMLGDVQVVQDVVFFGFCRELQFVV